MPAGITRIELLVLAKICIATDGSKSAHVPEHTFIKKFSDVKMARKALKKLVSGGYVARHPTASEMTYQMTQAGWEECRRMKAEVPRP
jgi:predicted MarR family transcription regulator